MAKIDELIRKQQEEVNKAKDDDKPVAQARLDALRDAKAAGVEMDNDEVNGVVTRNKKSEEERWKTLVGMEFDEAKKLFEDLEDDTVRKILTGGDSSAGDGEGDGEKPVAELIQEALRSRDTEIQSLKSGTTDLSRSLYSERVENRLKSALGAVTLDDGTKVSLKDGRFDRVRSLVGEGELVKQLMEGQTVEAGAFTERAKALYRDLPEVFVSPDGSGAGDGNGNGDGARVVAGHKIVEEPVRPHIPATPEGQTDAGITDEDRAARASSVY